MTGISTSIGASSMPKSTDGPPSEAALRVAADSCINEADLALWFNVTPAIVEEWFKENPSLRREFGRRKLEDIRELRMITRAKALQGNLQALERYVKMTFPGMLADKTPNISIKTEVRVLPTPEHTPLVIEGELDDAD